MRLSRGGADPPCGGPHAVRAEVRAAPWPQRVGSCAQVGSRSARARERDGEGGGGERGAGTWRAVQFVQ